MSIMCTVLHSTMPWVPMRTFSKFSCLAIWFTQLYSTLTVELFSIHRCWLFVPYCALLCLSHRWWPNTLQHIATHCNTLQHPVFISVDYSYRIALYCAFHNDGDPPAPMPGMNPMHNRMPYVYWLLDQLKNKMAPREWEQVWHAATRCNTLQHTATHCNTSDAQPHALRPLVAGPHRKIKWRAGVGAGELMFALHHTATQESSAQPKHHWNDIRWRYK